MVKKITATADDEVLKTLFLYIQKLKQSVADRAIDQWQSRLRVCLLAEAQHFEQLLLS